MNKLESLKEELNATELVMYAQLEEYAIAAISIYEQMEEFEKTCLARLEELKILIKTMESSDYNIPVNILGNLLASFLSTEHKKYSYIDRSITIYTDGEEDNITIKFIANNSYIVSDLLYKDIEYIMNVERNNDIFIVADNDDSMINIGEFLYSLKSKDLLVNNILTINDIRDFVLAVAEYNMYSSISEININDFVNDYKNNKKYKLVK